MPGSTMVFSVYLNNLLYKTYVQIWLMQLHLRYELTVQDENILPEMDICFV